MYICYEAIIRRINVKEPFGLWLIVIVIEREIFEKRRNVFFSDTSTSQHHNVVLHTLTHTLTNTLTHTHMTGQPWLVGQVVPGEFFFGFLQNWVFGTRSGQQNIF